VVKGLEKIEKAYNTERLFPVQ